MVRHGKRQHHARADTADTGRFRDSLGAARQTAGRRLGKGRDRTGEERARRIRLRERRCRIGERTRRHKNGRVKQRPLHRELQNDAPQPRGIRCQGSLLQLHARVRLDEDRPLPPAARRLDGAFLREEQDKTRPRRNGAVHSRRDKRHDNARLGARAPRQPARAVRRLQGRDARETLGEPQILPRSADADLPRVRYQNGYPPRRPALGHLRAAKTSC